MPNDIANNMVDTIHQFEKELKDLRKENKVLISECDRLIKEKGELLSKVSGGDILKICQLEEQLENAKRLLKLAIEDIYNARRGVNCGICDMPKNDIETEKRCEVDNVQPECKYRWKYVDKAEKLLNDEK